ncbi:hypothetical protein [Cupriavidus nantongensis]|uniref:Uncharacterized protein n=1 Tax=Cupriavidus nantongensis TaxID=1796606 RepID=A0A142JHT7_9BURK|nr:hypothetical protein [Cupriavidus nantongensis]AMR77649.1 hypothetical protein A2G96_07825 [Cupriavidus nantongensis]
MPSAKKPPDDRRAWHCYTCLQSSEAKEGSPCPLCGGQVIYEDPWKTMMRKKIAEVRALLGQYIDLPPKD